MHSRWPALLCYLGGDNKVALVTAWPPRRGAIHTECSESILEGNVLAQQRSRWDSAAPAGDQARQAWGWRPLSPSWVGDCLGGWVGWGRTPEERLGGWGHDEFSSRPCDPDVLVGPAWGAPAVWCGLEPQSTRDNVAQKGSWRRREDCHAVRRDTVSHACTLNRHRRRRKSRGRGGHRRRSYPRRCQMSVVTPFLPRESRDDRGENSARSLR